MKDILIRNIDINRWKSVGKRVLVYGRRKTGKSFFVKNFTQWDEYFFVKRDGGIIDIKNFKEVSYDYLKELIIREPEKRIVIDEFQRLPDEFLDFLHAFSENLNLVLITSTLWLSRKILNEHSPLLGIFEEFKINLIDERDAILFLANKLKGKELIDTAVFIREPWIIPLLNKSIYDEIPRIIYSEKNTIERLVGEVFREEGRELKSTYIAILFAIASGKMKSTEISNYLFNKKLIPKDDPSIIQNYLKVLCNIGLLEKLNVINKKFDLYLHSSPILDIYFYLDSKYGFSELEIPEEEIKKVVLSKLPKYVEIFIRNLFAKLWNLKPSIIIEKNHDIDIVLLSFKNIVAVGEVKWKNFVSKNEIRKIEENLNKIKCKEKFIVVPEKNILEIKPENITVYDINDIIKIVKEKTKIEKEYQL